MLTQHRGYIYASPVTGFSKLTQTLVTSSCDSNVLLTGKPLGEISYSAQH